MMENTQKMSGKKKIGAVFLTPQSIVAEIRCNLKVPQKQEDGKVQDRVCYKLRCLLDQVKLIELNMRIIENPRLLLEKPETDGFVAIFELVKGAQKGESVQ